jgi:hypothetical protein
MEASYPWLQADAEDGALRASHEDVPDRQRSK